MSGDGRSTIRGGEQDLIGGEQDLINDFEERAPALYNVNHPQEMTESINEGEAKSRKRRGVNIIGSPLYNRGSIDTSVSASK